MFYVKQKKKFFKGEPKKKNLKQVITFKQATVINDNFPADHV